MNILAQADEIVNNRSEEKERMYGNFDDSMDKTARIYVAMTGKEMTAIDVFYVMIALKLSRETHAHKEDNLLDIAAYVGAMNNSVAKKRIHEERDIRKRCGLGKHKMRSSSITTNFARKGSNPMVLSVYTTLGFTLRIQRTIISLLR